MSRYTQRSFTGGELSPALYARNDLAKYAIGLKTLKNGFVRAEGCVSNRAGLELVCEVKNSDSKVRIIPFSPALYRIFRFRGQPYKIYFLPLRFVVFAILFYFHTLNL